MLQAGAEASILIVGQAPGAKVHASGVPWHDRSGVRSPLYYERHRPEQTTLYRLVQQRAASFIAHTEASTGAELPRFLKDEFDAFLECGILAHGFLRLRCGDCGRGIGPLVRRPRARAFEA